MQAKQNGIKSMVYTQGNHTLNVVLSSWRAVTGTFVVRAENIGTAMIYILFTWFSSTELSRSTTVPILLCNTQLRFESITIQHIYCLAIVLLLTNPPCVRKHS